MKKYVIIGNSTAAIGAVEGIRSIDKDGSITIVSSEPHHTYSRPLISYLLAGHTDEEKMKYRPEDFYEKNNCETLLGKTVKSVDKARKVIVLEDREEIPYDKLLVATGSSAFVPPFDGLDEVSQKFTFMSLDDARSLSGVINEKSRVLIIGAGLIGLKCAEGISARVGKITVVDLAPRILSSILDEESASMVQRHIESHGIEFLLGRSVKSFVGDKAVMDDGTEVVFDVLVLAVGVRANTSLLLEAGGEVVRGIVADERQKTSVDDIYAAGDCTECFDVSCGTRRTLALLPNAYRQGECAGINMAGGTCTFDRAIPMNAIGFFGLHIVTAGSYIGTPHIKSAQGTYKKLFSDGGYLRGFILIGDVDKAGIYTSVIRSQIPLSEIDFDLIFEKPSLLAFSKKYRCEKLGSVV